MAGPMTTSTFTLEFGGVTMATFRKVSGLTAKTDVIEHKDVTSEGKLVIHKTPGTPKWDPLVCESTFTGDKALSDWRQLVLDGKWSEARRDGSIVAFDSELNEIARWNFEMGWPADLTLSDLDAGTNAIVTEKVTIQHVRLYRA